MTKKSILVKPVISEKANLLSEEMNQYTFVVDKRANKLEIKEAVEQMYNVAVASVNTVVVPGKAKSRGTRSGFIQGRKPSFKKAFVRLAPGEHIDFYGDI
jgi:large subunit ribosomal protein L23